MMTIRTWLLLIGGAAAAFGAEDPDLSKLAWMTGCWATPADRPGLVIDEHWSNPAGGNMLGYSRTFKGPRMVFFEFIRLEVKGGEVVYTPRYGTSLKPVSFRMVKQGPSDVVFENPEHDFPQRILYRREGDMLHAAIEGNDKGRPRREEFPYRKVACK